MEREGKKEISIKELFLNVALKWRILFLMGICFGIAIFISSYINSRREYTLIKDEVILTEEESDKVKDIQKFEKKIEQQKKYLEQSIMMNVDPMEKNVYVLQCYIDSDYTFNYLEENKTDYTLDIVSAYLNLVQSGKIAEVIIDKLDLKEDAVWLNEAISVQKDNSSFTITVTYDQKEKLHKIGMVIKESFKAYEETWKNLIGEYNLEIISEYETTLVDEDLVIKQNEAKSALQIWENDKRTMEKSLTSAQLALLQGKESDAVVSENNVQISSKKVIIGFCVGVIVGAFLLAIIYIISSKMQYTREIESIYGINLLGEVTQAKSKRKFLDIVDKTIIKIFYRGKPSLSNDELIKIICAKIYLYCRKAGADSIYIMGSSINSTQEAVIEKIKERLSEKNICVYNCGSIMENGKMIENFADVKIAMLLEQIGISRYDDIQQEVKFIKEQNIQILGAVIIDSK